MDVLADVIASLRLRGNIYCRTELSAPWGMRLPPADLAHFHVVQRGSCWLRLEGSETPVRLDGGDLVVLPHGRGHLLLDDPSTPSIALSHLVEAHVRGSRPLIKHGGDGAKTSMICGAFDFERGEDHPLLALLPQLIHVKGEHGQAVEWLETTLKFLADEADHQRPGADTIIARLIDVIFIQTLRAWIEGQPQGQGGWLGALRDPQVGAALGLIHRAPERDWTVAFLAAEVAMSRSSFSARFTALVGEPPLAYLTRWRMHCAASWLRSGDLSLMQIAERAGYESEAAFGKAFKRHFGVSPGAYRREVRAA